MCGHAHSWHPNRKNSLGLFHCMSPVAFFNEVFTSGCQLHIFICYKFLITSREHVRALPRLEDHNTGPYRVQNEQFVDDSQRKSKKIEKSSRPLWTKMFLSSINQRGARRSLPRRKDQDTAADLQGENAHVRSLLGLGLVASCDGHSIASESAV